MCISMKKGRRTRAAALALAFLAGINAPAGSLSLSVNAAQVAETEEPSSYEEDYIRQHLDFVESGEYQSIQETAGSFAGLISLAYQEAGLNAANRTWDQLSSFFILLGNGTVDEGLTNTLKITNKYDLLVSSLMQNSASQKSFLADYSASYLTAAKDCLNKIKEILEDTGELTGQISEDSLGKAEEIANRIDQVLITIQNFQGTDPEEMQTLYQDGLKEVKDKISSDFLKEDQDYIKAELLGVKIAEGAASVGAETFSDAVDAYLLYSACTNASQEWRGVWEQIAASAAASKDEESQLLAKSIQDILSRIETADADLVTALAEELLKSGTGNTLKYGIGLGSEALDKYLKTWSLGKAIRQGLVGGVTTANLITNCDDTAYYGEMLICSGTLAVHAWNVLKDSEAFLLDAKDLPSSSAFDQAFQIYREIQIAACDCAIGYYQSLATAPLGYIFKYTVSDEIAATYQILAQKATWQSCQCHREVTQVQNNGGNFVRCLDNTYYWRFAPGSFAQTGILGGFDPVPEVQSELVCRAADGTETVLLKDSGSGPLYICGDCIFYEKGNYSWGVCGLDGTPAEDLAETDLLAVSTEQETVIATNYEGGLFAITSGNTRTELAPAGSSLIGINGIHLYYAIAFEGGMELYRVRLDGLDTVSLGSVTLPSPELGLPSVGSALVRDDGIYFTCGCYGGTGNFFNGGGVYRINFDGGIDTLVDPYGERQVNFPKIYIADTEAGEILYYYCGDGYSNAGFWDSWVAEDVYGLNLETGEDLPADFRLSSVGDGICLDGSVWSLLDDSGQYTELIPAALAAQLGYPDLGTHSETGESFLSSLDVVEDTVYFTLTTITQDSSASVGWRTGYQRGPMQTYQMEIGSGEAILLNEY